MKAYIKNKTYNFDYPADMEKILQYLNTHGKLQVSDATVERLYRDFSDTRCAGWLGPDEDTLEAFADWLEDIDV
jgi:hypothetical protein